MNCARFPQWWGHSFVRCCFLTTAKINILYSLSRIQVIVKCSTKCKVALVRRKRVDLSSADVTWLHLGEGQGKIKGQMRSKHYSLIVHYSLRRGYKNLDWPLQMILIARPADCFLPRSVAQRKSRTCGGKIGDGVVCLCVKEAHARASRALHAVCRAELCKTCFFSLLSLSSTFKLEARRETIAGLRLWILWIENTFCARENNGTQPVSIAATLGLLYSCTGREARVYCRLKGVERKGKRRAGCIKNLSLSHTHPLVLAALFSDGSGWVGWIKMDTNNI